MEPLTLNDVLVLAGLALGAVAFLWLMRRVTDPKSSTPNFDFVAIVLVAMGSLAYIWWTSFGSGRLK